ncbi:MAG: hypothetical protein ACYCYJ_14670 [Trichloromonadaceae bacterium]
MMKTLGTRPDFLPFPDRALNSVQLRRQTDGTLVDVVNGVCRGYGVAAQQLLAQGKIRPFTATRALAALLVQEATHLSLTGLGQLLNSNIAPLGRAAKALAQQAKADAGVTQQLAAFRRDLGMAERHT